MLEINVISEAPINKLIMIERHYLKEKLIREYEFSFGFCMPKSKNSAEFIYDLPEFSEDDKEVLLKEPWVVKSDTFFFADGKLIIHNKAAYNYTSVF